MFATIGAEAPRLLRHVDACEFAAAPTREVTINRAAAREPDLERKGSHSRSAGGASEQIDYVIRGVVIGTHDHLVKRAAELPAGRQFPALEPRLRRRHIEQFDNAGRVPQRRAPK